MFADLVQLRNRTNLFPCLDIDKFKKARIFEPLIFMCV